MIGLRLMSYHPGSGILKYDKTKHFFRKLLKSIMSPKREAADPDLFH